MSSLILCLHADNSPVSVMVSTCEYLFQQNVVHGWVTSPYPFYEVSNYIVMKCHGYNIIITLFASYISSDLTVRVLFSFTPLMKITKCNHVYGHQNQMVHTLAENYAQKNRIQNRMWFF